jgi:dephospho-CoA kinase
MLKVGLTGGIGSGKSTVSSMLKEKGIDVIDADWISREIFDLYPEVAFYIRKEFGEGFFDERGMLKRRELGNYIFRYGRERIKLENIVIPFIKREIFLRLEEYDRKGVNICVVDAPTLIEQGLHRKMDYTILVWVDTATQRARVKKRDSLKDEQVADRINAQMSLDAKREYVDFIIDNSLELINTREQVEKVVTTLKACCN